MNKPVIAIDIDDVLSSQIDVFIEFSNRNYGYNLTRADFLDPGDYWTYYEKIWAVGKEEANKRFRRFLDDKYPLKQIISDEAKNAVKQLKKSYSLDIVTSRHAEMSDETRKWLLNHFPETFRGVHFTKLWGSDGEATKATICMDIGASYLIDDNADHCNLAADAGITALLLGEYGWSSYQQLHDKVVRVAGWPEVLEYFDERSRQ